jgi:hypothetical protein
MARVGRKALAQVDETVRMLLGKRMDAARAADLGHLLSQGVWTHDHPVMAPELEQLGLPIKVGVPDEERLLMELCREAARQRRVRFRAAPPARPAARPGQRARTPAVDFRWPDGFESPGWRAVA